jgi:two-component system LytT family response regulator
VVGEAEDGPSAVALIEEKGPRLVLLDIQMPVMSGFDVLRALAPERLPAVIFVTAYDEYAIAAFEVSAVDYLLKPFSEVRLREAIDKVAARIEGPWPSTIQGLLENLPHEAYLRQLPVHAHKLILLLDVDSISHIVSEQRIIHVYDQEGHTYWTNETLDQLQERLDPEQFFRIHRSSLVNLKSDFQIEPWEDGRLRLHLKGGNSLTVARERAKLLRERIGF